MSRTIAPFSIPPEAPLDEAASAPESEIEAATQDQLDALMEGRTVIAIAHRLSTIARMDRLVVLDRGRIAEMGSHSELLGCDGLYARLCAGSRAAPCRMLASASWPDNGGVFK